MIHAAAPCRRCMTAVLMPINSSITRVYSAFDSRSASSIHSSASGWDCRARPNSGCSADSLDIETQWPVPGFAELTRHIGNGLPIAILKEAKNQRCRRNEPLEATDFLQRQEQLFALT